MADERAPHKQLERLMGTLVENPINPLSEQFEITDADLAPYLIRRADFDIEAVPGPDCGILFKPLPQWKLDCHPIQATADEEESMEYSDYPDDPEARQKLAFKPQSCAYRIYRHLQRWVSGFPRVGYPHSGPNDEIAIFGLHSDVGWRHICVPNPYLLHSRGYEGRLGFAKGWSICENNEFKRTENGPHYPHLVIWTELHCNGHEGTLVYGEVAALISSLYARSVQRNIPDDRLEPEVQGGHMEADGLEKFSANPALLKKFDLAFGEEKQFPVLMVSCLGPQHARLLYAHMDGSTLVIYQSKLHSFEKRDTAPWDLFARWVLSTPVS